MDAHAENADTGPVGNQGAAGPSWSESPPRPVPLRRRHPRAPEDGGADRAAALASCLAGREPGERLAGTRGGVPRIAEAGRLVRRRRDPEGGSADRLEGAGSADDVEKIRGRQCQVIRVVV